MLSHLDLAEEAGFEPARACTPIGFRNRPLQPLGYSSNAYSLYQIYHKYKLKKGFYSLYV